jgi:catechol-2,3-dioxygenase
MFLLKTRIHLGVQDANRSAAFYEALLGAPPQSRTSSAAVFELASPPLVLSLESVNRRNRSRFSLFVTEPRHVADAAIALRRAGIRLRLEDEGVQVEDPDGNAWQVRLAPSGMGPTVGGPHRAKASPIREREARHR